MELNMISAGIELLGITVKELEVHNQIVDAEITIEFDIEIIQADDSSCNIHLSVEGAFLSAPDTKMDDFQPLVAINGASALIGIARGKIEAISASIFNNGKIVIPFVNVIDYYKESLHE